MIGSVDEALEAIGRVVKTADPKGPLTMLCWAAQAHIVSLLDSVFYLGFKGRSGAGKGTAVESSILLTPNGTILSMTTPAFLSSVLDEGRAIGIPEADRLLAEDPLIAKLLRDGYRRGASYGLMVPSGDKDKPWTEAERSIFGPKCFDFHVALDSHLLGRTVVVEMDPDTSVDRAMDAEKKSKHLAPVREWIAREAAAALKEWTVPRVDDLWESGEFRREVRALGGTTGRDHVVGATLLTVCRVLGWDYAKEVRQIVRGRHTLDELGEESEVADAIKSLSGWSDEHPERFPKDQELTVEALLQTLNERRARLKLRPLSPKGLAGVLVDLGFRRDDDWRKRKDGPNRDKVCLLPWKFLQGGLTVPSQASQPSQSTLDASHRPDEKPDSGSDGTDGSDGTGVYGGGSPVVEEADNWSVPPKDRARARPGREGGES